MLPRKVFLNDGWTFSESGTSTFLSIEVPGDINDALHKHGKLPDPHVGMQFRQYYPNSAKGWLFKKEFSRPEYKENAELVFEGLTGAAEIRLNGKVLGNARNAHRPHRFEVAELLLNHNNLLEVEFEPIEVSVGKPRRNPFGWGNERTMLRTPPFNFGWDWSVAVPSTGISGDVYFECDNALRWVNINYRTPEPGRADFFFEVSRAVRDAGYEVHLHLTGHGVDIHERINGNMDVPRWAIEEGTIFSQHRVFTTVHVPNAKEWLPNGTGEAALYDWKADIVIDKKIVDSKSGKLGFRYVRVVEYPFRKESGPGFSYEIEINGHRIFIKGANWIPVTLWPATATEGQYRRLLELARDAGFNMLRVWGGGIYERDLFYDLCDEYGIMVWQDFMFASNAYPVGILREEIKLEAEYQLKRLRLHPCIVHWCGINEDVFSWAYPGCGRLEGVVQADIGDYSGTGIWQFHDDPEIYSMILRGLTGLWANGVPYIESSPASHGDCGNLPQSGNCHFNCLGQVMNYPDKFREHFTQICSFNTEFGIQGPDSAFETRRFLGEENCKEWPPSNEEVWVAHLQRGNRGPLWKMQLDVAEKLIGPVDSFETFIRNGQVAHIELMRCEYEYYRANRPDCGGTMVWMFNDCWPTGNWSIINYYGRPKPAYYAAKRACVPCLPIVVSRAGKVEFVFDNQSLDDCQLQYKYGLMKLDGTVIWSREDSASAPANKLTRLHIIPLDEEEQSSPGDHYFLKVKGYDIVRCFYRGWRNIVFPAAKPTMEQVRPGIIKVSAGNTYVRMAHLVPKNPLQIVDFSDNYFDLGPNEGREIEVTADSSELKLLHWMSNWE
ncbi:MAG: hypothetical protein GX946_03365 [Oligosphaeraceae bacterium]|nr:hypothetical protein [Oligosphaeraceae bacterium]